MTSATENIRSGDFENIIATIMQMDVQASGPVPDDPREAYMRGIVAALMVLGVTR